MAQPLEQLSPPRARGTLGRPCKYPWSQWADGQIWLLVYGEDFDTKPATMVSTIYQYAKSHNLKVKLFRRDNGDIEVQFEL